MHRFRRPATRALAPVVLATLLGVSAGCSSVTVNQDFDPDYNLAVVQTFALYPYNPGSGLNELDAKRVAAAIRTELTRKGLREVDDPNIYVAMYLSTKQNTQIESSGYGYGRGWYGGMGSTSVSQYTSGTLVIDFADAAGQNLVWRGTGTAILDDNPNMEKKTENIDKAVFMILNQFRPE